MAHASNPILNPRRELLGTEVALCRHDIPASTSALRRTRTVDQYRVTLGRVGPGLFQLRAERGRNSSAITEPVSQTNLTTEKGLDDVTAQQFPSHERSLQE
jgi:hypothetical protein